MLYFLSISVLSLCLFAETLSAPVIPTSVGLLSPSCNGALEGVVMDPTASDCLNLPTLVNGLAGTSANQSWVPIIDNWLTGLCGRPTCNNGTIQQVVSNITSGCQKELQLFNMTGIDVTSLLTDMNASSERLGRGFLCLADNNQNATWCATDTLRLLERSIGAPLNPQSLLTELPLLVMGGLDILNSNVTCTDCSRATYALARVYSPAVASDTELLDELVHQCGDAFIDDPYPFNIVDNSFEATASVVVGTATATVTAVNGAASVATDGGSLDRIVNKRYVIALGILSLYLL